MTHNKNILLLNLVLNIGLITCFFSPAFSQDVFVDIGNADGTPGSRNNKVEISLSNPNNKVRGVQMQVCDDGNYLSSNNCSGIGRSSMFMCSSYDTNGCVNIVLFSMSDLIDEGDGPIAALSFNISDDAPLGECVSLIANFGAIPGTGRSLGVVSDENNSPLDVEADPGEFCFTAPCIISKILGGDSNESNILRKFKEDVLLGKKAGEELVDLYYQHSSEVLEIAVKHPEIKIQIKKVLIEMLPDVQQTIDEGNIIINTYTIKEINRLCEMLSEKAGTQLKQDIQKLQNDLNNGEIFRELGIKTK